MKPIWEFIFQIEGVDQSKKIPWNTCWKDYAFLKKGNIIVLWKAIDEKWDEYISLSKQIWQRKLISIQMWRVQTNYRFRIIVISGFTEMPRKCFKQRKYEQTLFSFSVLRMLSNVSPTKFTRALIIKNARLQYCFLSWNMCHGPLPDWLAGAPKWELGEVSNAVQGSQKVFYILKT